MFRLCTSFLFFALWQHAIAQPQQQEETPGDNPKDLVATYKDQVEGKTTTADVYDRLFYNNARSYHTQAQPHYTMQEIINHNEFLAAKLDVASEWSIKRHYRKGNMNAILLDTNFTICGVTYIGASELFFLTRTDGVWRINAYQSNVLTVTENPVSLCNADAPIATVVALEGVPLPEQDISAANKAAIKANSDLYQSSFQAANVSGLVSAFSRGRDGLASFPFFFLKIHSDSARGAMQGLFDACSPLSINKDWPYYQISDDGLFSFAQWSWYEKFSNPTEYSVPAHTLWVNTRKTVDEPFVAEFMMFNFGGYQLMPSCLTR